MKRYISLVFVWMLMGAAVSQEKYWVFFQDKGDLGQWNIESLLSPAAIDNRLSQGILPDESDFPVWPAYIAAAETAGAERVNTSRWLNAISVRMNPEQLRAVSALPCVKEVRPVAVYAHTTGLEAACPEEPDTSSLQLSMLGLDWLHTSGYDGKGVKIAVFDNGFFRVNELAAFAPLFAQNRILATRDYVDRDQTLYHTCGHCRHGTYVFSILAADQSSGLTGSAPGASYILLRTENDSSETHREEDNWIAAAEFADSLGAQIFTTSLGYSVFDPGQGNYTTADLDGNTALITLAADMAAAKGILVVNSAGNNGTDGLNAPADGDSVLAIASVDLCGQLSNFSSRGPSGDGRIKPDLAARGERTYYLNQQGVLLQGNGTSFSCPLISGLAACLIQAYPYAGASAIAQALRESADRYLTPDNDYGYGIPQAREAYRMLEDISPELVIYPNPAQGTFRIDLYRQPGAWKQIQLFDLSGREVALTLTPGAAKQVEVSVAEQVRPGSYVLRILWEDGAKPLARKVTLY